MSVNPVITDKQLEELVRKAIAKRWPNKKVEVQESLAKKILDKMKAAQMQEAEAINQAEAVAEAGGILDDVLSTQAEQSEEAIAEDANKQEAADEQTQNEAVEDEAMSQLPEEETTQNEMEIRKKGGSKDVDKASQALKNFGANNRGETPPPTADQPATTGSETPNQTPPGEAPAQEEEETTEEPTPNEGGAPPPPSPTPKTAAPSAETDVPVSQSKPIDLENEPEEEDVPSKKKLDDVARKFARLGYEKIDSGDGNTRFRRFDGQDVVYNDNGDFIGTGNQNNDAIQGIPGETGTTATVQDNGLEFERQRLLAEADATQKEMENTEKKIQALMGPVEKIMKEMDGKNKEIKKLQYLMLQHMGETVMLFLFGFICAVTIVLAVPGGFMIKEGVSMGLKALGERTKIQNLKHQLKPLKKQQEELMKPVQQQRNILKSLAQKRNQLAKIANQIKAS